MCVRPTTAGGAESATAQIEPQSIVPHEGELLPLQVGGASSSGDRDCSTVTGSTANIVADESVPEQGERFDGRTKVRPILPSANEIAEHEVTHYPYRDWCRDCVASAGRRDGHKRVSDADRDAGIATIAADYC